LGVRFGKYELLTRLAQGGMAELHLARATSLQGFEKILVLKRILPALAKNRDFVKMFLDEARIAATLNHANIVQIYDVGVVDGSYFIAMEYLHGEDLRSLSRQLHETKKDGRPPLELGVTIIQAVCAGLHYAHEKTGNDGKPLNIVHRDVTPQNIVVTFDGAVKLVDFGIAKAENRLGETRAGGLKGKIPYMSPEQCTGEELDHRSDVFSLGINLFEITTGRHLFPQQNEFEVLKLVVEGTIPSPRQFVKDYPSELEAILRRSLAKRREDRFQSTREMQVELLGFLKRHGGVATTLDLASFMEGVFPERITAWKQAQTRGETLEKHLAEDLPSRYRKDDEDVGSIGSLELPVLPPAFLDASAVSTEPVEHGMRRGWLVFGLLGLLALLGGGLLTYRAVGGPTTRAIAVPTSLAGPPPVAVKVTSSGAQTAVPAVNPAAPRTADGGVASLDPGAVGAAGAAEPAGEAPVAPEPDPASTAPAPAPGGASPAVRAARVRRVVARKPVPRGFGFLNVASDPWCEISIDGTSYGQTPRAGIKLSAGPHTLLLTNDKAGIKKRVRITIPPDETVKKRFQLK
jgi:serine/threonine protein kinase